MSTLKVWDIHLKYDGPITDEFMEGDCKLAESIAEEPGVLWKIWTHETGTNYFGSNYLFKNIEYLEEYRKIHLERLNAMSITDIMEYVFDILEDPSRMNHTPLELI